MKRGAIQFMQKGGSGQSEQEGSFDVRFYGSVAKFNRSEESET